MTRSSARAVRAVGALAALALAAACGSADADRTPVLAPRSASPAAVVPQAGLALRQVLGFHALGPEDRARRVAGRVVAGVALRRPEAYDARAYDTASCVDPQEAEVLARPLPGETTACDVFGRVAYHLGPALPVTAQGVRVEPFPDARLHASTVSFALAPASVAACERLEGEGAAARRLPQLVLGEQVVGVLGSACGQRVVLAGVATSLVDRLVAGLRTGTR